MRRKVGKELGKDFGPDFEKEVGMELRKEAEDGGGSGTLEICSDRQGDRGGEVNC